MRNTLGAVLRRSLRYVFRNTAKFSCNSPLDNFVAKSLMEALRRFLENIPDKKMKSLQESRKRNLLGISEAGLKIMP